MIKQLMFRSATLLAVIMVSILAGCGGGGGGGVAPSPEIPANSPVYSALISGEVKADGSKGITALVKTDVPFSGLPMIPEGITLSNEIRSLIVKNANSYLTTTGIPVFDPGTPPYPAGVTITQGTPPRISVTDSVNGTTVSWDFSANSVLRAYDDGIKKSSYTFSQQADGTTRAAFDEISENPAARYNGTALYQKNSDGSVANVISALFDQTYSTTVDGITNSANGTVTMSGGTASFKGDYSVYIPLYDTVISGTADIKGLSYDWVPGTTTTVNSTTSSTTVSITSKTDLSTLQAIVRPEWLKGDWQGSMFIDGSAGQQGILIVTASLPDSPVITWSGQLFGDTVIYGSKARYFSDSDIRLYDTSAGQVVWGTAMRKSDTEITGTWSFSGKSGTFSLIKQ
jgi:hypothetical protein